MGEVTDAAVENYGSALQVLGDNIRKYNAYKWRNSRT